jgi:hypothetical protein
MLSRMSRLGAICSSSWRARRGVTRARFVGRAISPKLLLQSEGRAKVCAGHQIEFDHMAGVNFDL